MFPPVFPYLRVDSHVLLTRLPLSPLRRGVFVRLACVRPAASVRSEPGSNSQVQTKCCSLIDEFSPSIRRPKAENQSDTRERFRPDETLSGTASRACERRLAQRHHRSHFLALSTISNPRQANRPACESPLRANHLGAPTRAECLYAAWEEICQIIFSIFFRFASGDAWRRRMGGGKWRGASGEKVGRLDASRRIGHTASP